MKTIVIGAGSDLGTHIDGAHLGPVPLLNDLKGFYQEPTISYIQDENIIKSRNLSDRRKNEYEIDKYNSTLYDTILEKINNEFFPITIGGDHTVSIASALASTKAHNDIGIIWIDAHADFNTFETTITGNIHGLPLAAITGYKNHELRYYHDGNTINQSNAVLVGAREFDEREKENLKYSGVTVFTTEDIKQKGIEAIMDEAFKIAGNKTNGIHISYDIDVIDPSIAPGVSVAAYDGITEEEAMKINEYIIKNIDQVVSYDLVEYNPLRDLDRKTEQIAINLIAQIIAGAKRKDKYGKINLNNPQMEKIQKLNIE